MKMLTKMIVLTAMLAFSVGCSDEETLLGSGVELGSGAELRVVHSSPDAPAVDVYAEGVAEPIFAGLAYGEATSYRSLNPGDYNIQLRKAGADPGSAPVFETGLLTIPDGARITALAAGLLTSASSDDRFRILTLVEGFKDPGAGSAAVRIVHAGPDAPTVALDVGNDGVPEVSNFARFGETGAAGVALPSDTEIQIAVWAGNPLTRVTVFTTPRLPDGGELFVIATGLLNRLPREVDGFSLLAIAPTGAIGFIKQNPVVFALHASPDAPPVDIYAGSTILAGNLEFGMLSGAIQVPPASYTLDFKAAGDMNTAASLPTPELVSGERYLAIASGFLLAGAPEFRLLPVGDSFSADLISGALVRVVHASPDAPIVDVGTVAGGVLTPVDEFSGLAFEGASKGEGTPLPVGTLPIGIAKTTTTTPVATFDVTTMPGLKAFVVAAGSLEGTGKSFRLLVVDTTSFPWAAAEIQPNL